MDVSVKPLEKKPEQQQGCDEQPPATLQLAEIPLNKQGCNVQPPEVNQPQASLPPPYVGATPQGCNEQPPMVNQPQANLPPTYAGAGPQGYYGQPPVPHSVNQHTNNTTVVVAQQTAGRALTPRPWTTGLLGCFDDCGICFNVLCCYSCATSSLAQDTGENSCMPCCVPNWLTALRAKVRTQLGIEGSICGDCFAAAFCHLCALCQLKREVKFARQNGLM